MSPRSMMRPLLLLSILMAAPAFSQDPGWIGVSVADGPAQGVIVRSVESDGPAAKAGLRENDLIVEFNRTPVVGVLQLTRLVRETPVGRTVEVKARRDNRDQTFQVTTADAPLRNAFRIDTPDLTAFADRAIRNLPQIRIEASQAVAGIRASALTPQLREYFGVKGTEGVLVASVESGSSAERAGLKAGDVIIAVDGDGVGTTSEFRREMRSAGEKITLKIVRDKQERELTLDLPAARTIPARRTIV